MENRAELLYRVKLALNSSLVREIIIWKVPRDENYPEGIKYKITLSDTLWKKVLIALENTHDFTSVENLISDYLKLESEEEKKYENNEN